MTVTTDPEIEAAAKMTPNQIDLARHALGLRDGIKKSYRNYFVAGTYHDDYPEWMAMAANGFAIQSDGRKNGDYTFWLTPAGATAALKPGEKLDPEDFPVTSTAASSVRGEGAAFGASYAACYHWPEDTAEHKALRAAYIQGAADSVSPPPSPQAVPDGFVLVPKEPTHEMVCAGAVNRDRLPSPVGELNTYNRAKDDARISYAAMLAASPSPPRASPVMDGKLISHDKAAESLQRLINSHFNQGTSARVSIPAQPDYDDDLILSRYIEQQRAAKLTLTPEAIARVREALDGIVLVCGRTGDAFTDFEEQAEVFQKETGWMRPGKDMPAAYAGDERDDREKRYAKYDAWVKTKLNKAREALIQRAEKT